MRDGFVFTPCPVVSNGTTVGEFPLEVFEDSFAGDFKGPRGPKYLIHWAYVIDHIEK